MSNKKKPLITVLIVGINLVIFFILAMFGMTEDGAYMLKHGAMYVPYIVNDKEYYRLFTSVFLHFGFDHLMNNMVMLFFLGSVLEEEIGSLKYLCIYLLSGLGGNLLSAFIDVKTGNYVVSAGASGAIFGIIGALLFIVIRNHGRLGNMSGRGLIFMTVCSIYHGFTSAGVDNMAHVGGLLSGFVIAVILYRKRYGKGRANIRN